MHQPLYLQNELWNQARFYSRHFSHKPCLTEDILTCASQTSDHVFTWFTCQESQVKATRAILCAWHVFELKTMHTLCSRHSKKIMQLLLGNNLELIKKYQSIKTQVWITYLIISWSRTIKSSIIFENQYPQINTSIENIIMLL